MEYLLGIDIGTSGTKTVLFDAEGSAVASHTKEYPLYHPENGWAEQNPLDWWNATKEGICQVLQKSGIASKLVKGIGLSGQMHGLVMLDEKGNVLRPSILWCDGRTEYECDEITQKVGAQRLIEISANPALPGFTAGKILWVRRHEPELYKRCQHILLPKDYIRYCLTGVYASEMSDASGTNLLDVPHRRWSQKILEKLEIDQELLPKLYESPEITGTISQEASKSTGLTVGTPVVGGAGDNAAAAVGMGVVEEGSAFTTIGTSGVVFVHSNHVAIDPTGRVHTFCHAVPGCWTVMSCTLSAGLSLKWFRDNFCTSEIETALGMGVDPYVLMDKQASRVPIGSHRLIYLPYLMGERSPLLDAGCRGAFFGLSAIHTKADLLRATMEGVIYSLRDCLEVFREMGIDPEEMLACGGGGTSTLWRQMLADVFACPVKTVGSTEGPALGAAILAGVGVGIYPSVEEGCRKLLHYNNPQLPILENTGKYDKVFQIYRKLYPRLKDLYGELSHINP